MTYECILRMKFLKIFKVFNPVVFYGSGLSLKRFLSISLTIIIAKMLITNGYEVFELNTRTAFLTALSALCISGAVGHKPAAVNISHKCLSGQLKFYFELTGFMDVQLVNL